MYMLCSALFNLFFPLKTNSEQQVKILELQDKLSKVGKYTLLLIMSINKTLLRSYQSIDKPWCNIVAIIFLIMEKKHIKTATVVCLI